MTSTTYTTMTTLDPVMPGVSGSRNLELGLSYLADLFALRLQGQRAFTTPIPDPPLLGLQVSKSVDQRPASIPLPAFVQISILVFTSLWNSLNILKASGKLWAGGVFAHFAHHRLRVEKAQRASTLFEKRYARRTWLLELWGSDLVPCCFSS